LDATAKTDFARCVFVRRKTDGKWLLRLQWYEKLNGTYDSKLAIFAPLTQSCENFIEDQYARYERRAGKMPRQAGMIRPDGAANFKVHAFSIF